MAPRTQLTRENVGFLLAKALQRWNEVLSRRFTEKEYGRVRPQYGSVLVPLYEEDGLPMGELARRARLRKQTMTTMIRRMEHQGLLERRPDSRDGRVTRIFLSRDGRAFRGVAEEVLREMDQALGREAPAVPISMARAWLKTIADLEI